MVVKLLMPALSPTMKDGLLAKWYKKEGDQIKIGDLLADIGTDKATMELESIYEGKLAKILVKENTENVPVNSLIAMILEEGDDENLINDISSNQVILSNSNVNERKSAEKTEESKTEITQITLENRVAASPLARRLAEQNNIILHKITGSGPNGRIIKDDILSFLANNNSNLSDNLNNTKSRSNIEYTKIPNNNMRKIIAKRLSESKRDIPHFYLEIECEMDKLLNFRKELNLYYEKSRNKYKISVNDFIIKAVAFALNKVPIVNSSWTDEAILQYNNIDIAVAVSVDSGLITPIIKNVDQKPLSEISETMKDLALRARNSNLKPEEFQGGSFTITNLGMFEIDNFKAIINPPQSAILAVGSSKEKPIVRNGSIMILSMMKVTISCDHRVIDGAIAAKFLSEFRNFIENPALMLAV